MPASDIVQRIALTGSDEIKKSLQDLGATGEKAFKQLQQAAAQVTGPGPGLSQGIANAGAALGKVGTLISDAGSKLSDFGKSFSVNVSAPLIALGTLSVKAFSDFEDALNQVAIHVDTSKESVSGLGDKIKELSTTTPIGLVALTKAFADIRASGISAADGLTVLKGSADLAVATGADISETAKVVSSAIRGFGLTGADVGKTVNTLFETIAHGNLTLTDLSDLFGKVGITLKATNIPLDQYLTALATLSQTGLGASGAQRDLNLVLQKLSAQSKETAKDFHDLGATSFADLVAKSGGFVQALKKMVDASAGSNDQLLKLFGSIQGVGAVLALTTTGFDTYIANLAKARGGNDDFANALARNSQSIGSQFTEIANQFQVLAISIGSDLAPAVLNVLHAVESAVAGFDKLSPSVKGVVEQVGVFFAILGPGALAIGKLVEGLGFLVGGLANVAKAGALVVGFLVAMDPFVLAIVAALGIMDIALLDITRRQNGVADSSSKMSRALADQKKGFEDAAKSGKDAAAAFSDAAQKAATEGVTAAQAAVDAINNVIAKIAAVHPKSVPSDLIEQQKALTDTLDQKQVFLQKLNDQIAKQTFDLNQAANAASTAQAGAVVNVGAKIADTARVISNGVILSSAQLKKLSGNIIEVGTISAKSSGDANAALAKIGEGAQQPLTVIAGLGKGIQAAGDDITKAAQGAGNGFVKMGDDVSAASTSVAGLRANIDALGATGADLAKAVDLSSIASSTDQILQTLTDAASRSQGLSDAVKQAASDAANAWIAVPDAIRQAASAAADAAAQIVNAFSSLAGGISGALNGIGPALSDQFGLVVAAIQTQLALLQTDIASFVAAANTQIASLIAAANAASSSLHAAGGQGHATGGPIYGPGTSTSDSILARLSRGEFVIKAAAVRHYGADLFAMLNAMRLPGFAGGGSITGGLLGPSGVPGSLSGLGAGGGGGRPMTLVIGGTAFGGITASQETATQLGRYVVGKRARSAGHRPSWYSLR